MNAPGGKDQTYDVIVVGSGASGLAAAVTAAHHGLSVLVLEKHARFGGASAWSGGWLWVPRNLLAIEAGIVESRETIRRYLRAAIGNRYDAPRIEAFLTAAPEMVRFLRDDLGMVWLDGNAIPDMLGDLPGAGTGGRSVTAAPFDGRRLGRNLRLLRRPKRETSFLRMGIASGADLGHFMRASRSVRSFFHVARRVLRHIWDSAVHGRGCHLVSGNALVARLAEIAFAQGVEIRVSAPVTRLLEQAGRIGGVETADGSVMAARRGVVLAAGGYPADPQRRRDSFPHAPTGREHWTAAPPESTGDGLRLAEAAGGQVASDLAHPASWAPVSLVPHRDGSHGHFPHLIERAKPGIIGVTADGRRFANEADGYHQLVGRLLEVTPPGARPVCWLIAGHGFVRRYGLGHAKPALVPLGPALRSGYLRRNASLAGLASDCGIDPAGLEATVAEYDRDARNGRDPRFGRGATPYNRANGDAAHQPNPCVAPIGPGPFYAVEILPGSLGTFAGLRVDARARVLDGADCPLAGLYAVGTDAASIMGGSYPAGGINLGPGMTFGFVAGRDLAGLPKLLDDCEEKEIPA